MRRRREGLAEHAAVEGAEGEEPQGAVVAEDGVAAAVRGLPPGGVRAPARRPRRGRQRLQVPHAARALRQLGDAQEAPVARAEEQEGGGGGGREHVIVAARAAGEALERRRRGREGLVGGRREAREQREGAEVPHEDLRVAEEHAERVRGARRGAEEGRLHDAGAVAEALELAPVLRAPEQRLVLGGGHADRQPRVRVRGEHRQPVPVQVRDVAPVRDGDADGRAGALEHGERLLRLVHERHELPDRAREAAQQRVLVAAHAEEEDAAAGVAREEGLAVRQEGHAGELESLGALCAAVGRGGVSGPRRRGVRAACARVPSPAVLDDGEEAVGLRDRPPGPDDARLRVQLGVDDVALGSGHGRSAGI